MTNVSFIELNSRQFNVNTTNANLVRLRITRADIRSGRVGNLVDQLMQLSDTKEGVINWQDKLIIGAEMLRSDSREASEIPELVRFFRNLTRQWPYWLHFAEKRGGTVGAVLRLLVGSERMMQSYGSDNLFLTDADQVRSKAKWLFGQVKHLYNCHGIEDEAYLDMAKAVTASVNTMFHKT
jgi:hypothetical protein